MMQSRIICFLEITASENGWIIIWESSHDVYVFIVFLTDGRLNNLLPYNIMV